MAAAKSIWSWEGGSGAVGGLAAVRAHENRKRDEASISHPLPPTHPLHSHLPALVVPPLWRGPLAPLPGTRRRGFICSASTARIRFTPSASPSFIIKDYHWRRFSRGDTKSAILVGGARKDIDLLG